MARKIVKIELWAHIQVFILVCKFKTMNILKGKHLFLINISFLLIFIIHIFTIGYNLKHPDYPEVRTRFEDLKNVDFPVSFKMCLTEHVNATERYKRIGYLDEIHFFWGRSRFNRSLIGWKGHTEEGLAYGSMEG